MDRALESRIDWEHFTVNREDHRTVVKPFPTSVEFPDPPAATTERESTYVERGALLRELGVEALFLGVGVDRVDYTKGILERFLAIERMLEKHPTYQGKTLVRSPALEPRPCRVLFRLVGHGNAVKPPSPTQRS